MGWLGNKVATIADLFAGTAGMGLASVLTPALKGKAEIVFVGELEAEYVTTIRQNYDYFSKHIGASEQIPNRIVPTDISDRKTLDILRNISKRRGRLTLLLAGPPCQGFSTANRISRNKTNPKNLLALRTIDAIKAAHPKIAVIENVPGIQTMASAKRSSFTVTEHIEFELRSCGYFVHTTLLNAANFGVPQHRSRSFTIAICKSIADAFDLDNLSTLGQYGPGQRFPYRTVRDAFSDLPEITDGTGNIVASYASQARSSLQHELREHSGGLYDHVTSKHAPYVLERFSEVPPGGNWKSIRHKLHNYSKPDNTHTNIYHRLDPKQPSRTIGNFRKAMTIHPWENRGLSLREAARLQSLPDWLRFFDDTADVCNGQLRGLGARQQQVGNAVCFKLTHDLVSHLFANA